MSNPDFRRWNGREWVDHEPDRPDDRLLWIGIVLSVVSAVGIWVVWFA